MNRYIKVVGALICLILSIVLLAGCGQPSAATQPKVQNQSEQIKGNDKVPDCCQNGDMEKVKI